MPSLLSKRAKLLLGQVENARSNNDKISELCCLEKLTTTIEIGLQVDYFTVGAKLRLEKLHFSYSKRIDELRKESRICLDNNQSSAPIVKRIVKEIQFIDKAQCVLL
jgi:hypothetical protein